MGDQHNPDIPAVGNAIAGDLADIEENLEFHKDCIQALTDGWSNTSTAALVLKQPSFIGDTANANNTKGFTVNQGDADDEIISLKSSDVAHAMTDVSEADTFGKIEKVAGSTGGLVITGLGEGAVGMKLQGYVTTEDATDPPDATANAPFIFSGGVTDAGTDTQAVGDDSNLFVVRNKANNKFVVKGDGELYSDQSATVGTFDAYDDAMMVQDLSHVLSQEYSRIMQYNKETFEKLKIMGADGMVSLTKTNMLLMGAVSELFKVSIKLCDKLGITYEEAKK